MLSTYGFRKAISEYILEAILGGERPLPAAARKETLVLVFCRRLVPVTGIVVVHTISREISVYCTATGTIPVPVRRTQLEAFFVLNLPAFFSGIDTIILYSRRALVAILIIIS
jgi:hypothetical protein